MNTNLNELNFSNSIFSKNNLFEWPYGVDNAKEILEYASNYNNIFELLCDCEYLTGELNFYNFHLYVEGKLVAVYHNYSNYYDEISGKPYRELCLDEKADDLYKNLSICDWSYDKIIGSCIFCVLENAIMINNSFGEIKTGGLHHYINYLTEHLVLTKHLNSIFLDILNETKVFECAKIECLTGFLMYFDTLNDYNYEFNNVFKKDSLKYNLESLKRFLFFLGATESEIEKIIINCHSTNTFQPVSNYIVKKINSYEK